MSYYLQCAFTGDVIYLKRFPLEIEHIDKEHSSPNGWRTRALQSYTSESGYNRMSLFSSHFFFMLITNCSVWGGEPLCAPTIALNTPLIFLLNPDCWRVILTLQGIAYYHFLLRLPQSKWWYTSLCYGYQQYWTGSQTVWLFQVK